MKIAIVEDEIRTREGLAKLIARLDPGYEVIGEASNGADGLELIRRERPDVALTDIRMPGMDGLEMLCALAAEGALPKVIVLSAYSEFEYARQAMRLGVKEYLVKPIGVSDLTESLRRVEAEIHREKERSQELFDSEEQAFRAVLSGALAVDDAVLARMERNFGISRDARMQLICVYLGARYAAEAKVARAALEKLLSGGVMIESEGERTVGALVCGARDVRAWERFAQIEVLENRSFPVRGTVGVAANLSLRELRAGVQGLMRAMEWNISLGDGTLISYPATLRRQTALCVYPLEIESHMKRAVCGEGAERIEACVRDFEAYFRSGKVCEPRQIKDCYVRFLLAMTNTGKEVGALDAAALEQQALLEQVARARTEEELRTLCARVARMLRDISGDDMHLTVKRAQQLIQEFYQTGITLEEIASKLNITPEYLSARFHRETGKTFSAYIRELRITKAKELLIGTRLKLYEIAAAVGYADPKYFSKVFREEAGMLPADYRKAHR